jgi:hypothetical protein
MSRGAVITPIRDEVSEVGTEQIGSDRQMRSTGPDESATMRLPFWVWAVTLVAATWGAFSSNPVLTPLAVLLLPSCAQLLWRRGEPPVLVWGFGMQWLQASAIIFYTDIYGVSLGEASGSPVFEEATWLSLVAVFVLALGMRIALIRCRRSQHGALRADALRVDIANAFIAYSVGFVIAVIAQRLAFAVPAVTQVIYALTTLKWISLFILAYSVIEQRRGFMFLGIAVLIEVAFGLFAYFSSFKSVFFILLVAALSSPVALKGKRLFFTALIACALFASGIIWSAVKSEYREFLNQGSGFQEVVVSADEGAEKLGDLVSNLSWDNVADGLDAMILRIGYVQFFALTIVNVPDGVPYENGALWLGALKHIVTPRLLFPEKEAISDSNRTRLYTGVQVANEEQGTSIGIGYVAESYVDFGPIGMFVPIFILGACYGVIYRVLIVRSRSKLICAAIASAVIIFGGYSIDASNIKIVGGNVTVLLVMGVLYFVFGQRFRAWLQASR